MKKLLMLLYFNITFIITVLSQAGSLDPSFGNNGYIESESPNLHQMGYNSIAVQSDGRILVIKQVGQYGWFDFAMNRYNPNGTLDVDFGTDGTVVTDFGNSLDFPFDIVIQPDGKIIVVGFSNAPNIDASSIAMCRYNTDGALDVNFGVNRIVTTTPGSLVLLATSVALQSDGKIVVVGAVSSVGVDFGISRYNTNGTLDASFGINGSMITDLGTYRYDYPTSIAIQADGKIVVAGYTYYVNITSAEDYNLAVCRYNSDGTLDANFGQDGLVIRDPELDMYFNSTPIAIQNDGKIIIAMTTFVNFTVHSDFALC